MDCEAKVRERMEDVQVLRVLYLQPQILVIRYVQVQCNWRPSIFLILKLKNVLIIIIYFVIPNPLFDNRLAQI
jgi:hypothetical protein